MKLRKVAIGLSGGVDSAVAAALLLEQKYEVTGVFLICYQGPGCRTDQDRKDALDVALKLGIPFEVLDYRKEYQEQVLEYFKMEYAAGRTPNPDVVCNREIKFGLFFDWARKNGFDQIATGHYAQIDRFKTGDRFGYRLIRAADEKKDQTYFLYQLRAEQLPQILFPVGGVTKVEVRRQAGKLGLSVAEKPDSQGICFVGEVTVPEFLKKMGVRESKGAVLNTRGERIGWHRGAWFYTIGQRHGFRVDNMTPDSKPLFVVAKEVKKNQLIVGTRAECIRKEFEVSGIHLVGASEGWLESKPKELKVRIRHGGGLIVAEIEAKNSQVKVILKEAQFGVAPGQSVVFYQGRECLGGGIII